VAPKVVGPLGDTIHNVLKNGLATRFGVKPNIARKILPDNIEQWGKLCCLEGGDIMYMHDIVSKCMDSCNVKVQGP